MALKSFHPLYSAMLDAWEMGRDSYEGEEAIKAKGQTYLPPTSGQIQDGWGSPNTLGQMSYDAYKTRAVYPDIYKEAVEAIIGIMHRKPPKFELTPKLEEMVENASRVGETLEMVLRNINANQLISGRVGVLGDILVDKGEVRPVITLYKEKCALNWDDAAIEDDDLDLRLLVLDESSYRMEGLSLEWELKEEYLILALIDNEGKPARDGVYASTRITEDGSTLDGAAFKILNIRGTTLDTIPFSFINSKDLSPKPDQPPLKGLAHACLSIYRGEADYRQNLFMQGQDTLVRIGANANNKDDAVRVGAGARIDVPIGGDAKYIGVSSAGLSEQRQALANDYARAISKSGQIMDATSRARESGDALRLRISAQTATIPQIAKTGAAGLQKVLKELARWLGDNPDDVKVIPNLDFTNDELNGKTIVDMMTAKNLGAPISDQTIHERMAENGVTTLSYEEEIERINEEEPRI